jgi:hypothetical protein
MMIPIQIKPNSPLHRLRKRYGRNRREHIEALEQTIIETERQRDAVLYELQRQRQIIQRLRFHLEHLQ